MTIDEVVAQMKSLNEAVGAMGKSSHGTNEELKGLSNSLLTYGKLIKGTFLAHMTEKLVIWAKEQVLAQREIVKVNADKAKQINKEYIAQKEILDQIKKEHPTAKIRLNLQNDIVKALKNERDELMKDARWRAEIIKLVKEHKFLYGAAALTLTFFSDKLRDVVAVSHEYNQALIQANTDIDHRYQIIGRTLAVQTQLGASTRETAEAAEALVDFGQEMTPSFQSNLKIVTMMREALGVSARTGAQLVTIFSRQLRESAEKVGDVIASIAAQTGLAAERAAEFAIEIGHALRLLGAGFKTEAAGVTQFITGLAGRVQEMGGNAQSIVQAFKAMSGGSSQAFFMRGFAGVTPGMLGSEAGAEMAMRGLVNRMNAIITAPEGVPAFLAQVEAVAEITGMSAEDVINFRQAMQDLKKPLTEAQQLQKAYSEQSALVGKAFVQLREAGQALIMRGLLPIMPYVTSTVKFLADVGKAIASWEPLVPIVGIGIVTAATVASIALSRLAWNIAKVAWAAKGATVMKQLELQFTPGLGSQIGKFFKAGPMGLGLGGLIGGSVTALGIGAAIGTVLDRKFPDNILSTFFKTMFKWYYEGRDERIGNKLVVNTGKRLIDVFAESGKNLADVIMRGGNVGEAIKGIEAQEKQAMKMYPELHGGSGRQYALDTARKTIESAAMIAVLRRGTEKTEADKAEDQALEVALDALKVQKAQLDAQLKIQGATRTQSEILRDDQEKKKRENEAWLLQNPAYLNPSMSKRNSFNAFP